MAIHFEIGDLVYVKRPGARTRKVTLFGKTGCVKHIDETSVENIGVDFGEDVGGHNLKDHCNEHYGYYMQDRDVLKMEPVDVLVKKQLKKEYESKIKNDNSDDSIILLEE